MKGLILAAGRGGRMGALTSTGPKCFLEVAGRTLLERQVAALRAAGAEEVGVVAGWRAERFADWPGLTVIMNPAWMTTTMVGSLAAAEAWLSSGPVLVSYGDIVYTVATARAVAAAEESLAIAYDPGWYEVWTARFDRPLEDAETFRLDAAGQLVDIGRRPASCEEDGQYVGLLKFTPDAWAVLAQVRRSAREDADLTMLLGHVVAAGQLTVGVVPVAGLWWEFDCRRDLEVGRRAVDEIDRLDVTASSTPSHQSGPVRSGERCASRLELWW